MSCTEYRGGLQTAGFTGIRIAASHEVADGLSSLIVRAVKPAT